MERSTTVREHARRTQGGDTTTVRRHNRQLKPLPRMIDGPPPDPILWGEIEKKLGRPVSEEDVLQAMRDAYPHKNRWVNMGDLDYEGVGGDAVHFDGISEREKREVAGNVLMDMENRIRWRAENE